MKKMKIDACLFYIILLAALFMCACGRGTTPAGGEKDSNEAQGPEVSDLDQPLEKLLSAICEHDIPMYTCDECRYEVGIVKAPDSLFGEGSENALEKSVLGTLGLASGRESNGEVRLNEERSVYLSPRAAGVVRSINVDIGSRVSSGQVLFEVDSSEFRQARSAYIRAVSALELAQASERRSSDLFDKGYLSQKDMDDARSLLVTAEAEQRAAEGDLVSLGLSSDDLSALLSGKQKNSAGLMPVRAPFDGTVLERNISLGLQAEPGDRNMLIADTSKMWVQAAVYESDMAMLLEDQKKAPVDAEVTVKAYPSKVFRGMVERIGGTFDETTRAAQARVVVENPENLLRAGMFAKVRLLGPSKSAVLALPDEAVLSDEGRDFVFVHVKGPYYARRPVSAGPETGGFRAVSGGVKAGDVIVTKGAFLLKSDVLRSKMGAGCAD